MSPGSSSLQQLARQPVVDPHIAEIVAAIEARQVQPIVQQRPQGAVREAVVVLVDVPFGQVDGRDRQVVLNVERGPGRALFRRFPAPAEPYAAGFPERGKHRDRKAADDGFPFAYGGRPDSIRRRVDSPRLPNLHGGDHRAFRREVQPQPGPAAIVQCVIFPGSGRFAGKAKKFFIRFSPFPCFVRERTIYCIAHGLVVQAARVSSFSWTFPPYPTGPSSGGPFFGLSAGALREAALAEEARNHCEALRRRVMPGPGTGIPYGMPQRSASARATPRYSR